MKAKYSIFLSTCDAYQDCWDPFFFLLRKYWPDYDGTVYMVTDNLTYHYDGVDIKCLNINQIKGISPDVNISWGKRMKWAMEMVTDDIVLFLQEDFFIKGNVRNQIINEFVQLMNNHEEIKCLHITRPKIKDSTKSEFEHLYNMKVKQRYRADCQPALWRKDELYAILEDDYSPWQMEVLGSRKSSRMKHRYLIVDKEWIRPGEFEIFPYVKTGISKAKWLKDVVPVFADNGIEIDYSVRGFFENSNMMAKVVNALNWRFKLLKRTFLQMTGKGGSSF